MGRDGREFVTAPRLGNAVARGLLGIALLSSSAEKKRQAFRADLTRELQAAGLGFKSVTLGRGRKQEAVWNVVAAAPATNALMYRQVFLRLGEDAFGESAIPAIVAAFKVKPLP